MTQQAILFVFIVLLICWLAWQAANIAWPRRTPSDPFAEPFGDVTNKGGRENE